jgi:hypothetical protein
MRRKRDSVLRIVYQNIGGIHGKEKSIIDFVTANDVDILLVSEVNQFWPLARTPWSESSVGKFGSQKSVFAYLHQLGPLIFTGGLPSVVIQMAAEDGGIQVPMKYSICSGQLAAIF